MGISSVVGIETLRGALDGSGDGSGYGYGYGDGSGYGSAYGSGDGSGYGYGAGSGDYWRAVLTAFVPQGSRLRLAFWRSDANGYASNGGGRLAPAAQGVIHRAAGPVSLCRAGTLHATLNPPKWKGERVWIVVLRGEVIGDDEKLGCLEREILMELPLAPR